MTEPKKIGIVSCSGEELPEGTISRIATRIVMDKLKPGLTTTICLPLFLTGGGNEREFAKKHPTITIDGCEKMCAAIATEKYSGKPILSLNVKEILSNDIKNADISRQKMGPDGRKLAHKVAKKIAEKIDHYNSKK